MRKIPLKVEKRLESRKEQNAYRVLSTQKDLIDFSSNDYLGFAVSKEIYRRSGDILSQHDMEKNGATGSRLLSGNHKLLDKTEAFIAEFHNSEAALIFNSGYDANLGFFSAVPGRGDIILYDGLVHASIRDGISLSHAKSLKFKHNDLRDLEKLIERSKGMCIGEIYIVTESVFSMDGDSPDLSSFAALAEEKGCFLLVDEAHAVGVHGKKGEGLIPEYDLEDKVFARIITFGKAFGAHGAAVLGSTPLRNYLINFSRSFIFTTALPPHSVAAILAAYEFLEGNGVSEEESRGLLDLEKLRRNITFFRAQVQLNELRKFFIHSNSAIHCCLLRGNERVKEVSSWLGSKGFEVKPILSPTVPAGHERLRFCLHSYNSEEEISRLLMLLATFVK